MKKILVTWGAGFVWVNLCESLLNDWHEVICLDNLMTSKKENLKKILEHKNFSFVLHDVTNPFSVVVDEIYNLACPASPIHYQKHPIETTKTSVLWALNMLDLAHKTWAKILQASTSEVYWDPYVHPQPESYLGNVNPIWVRSCYDEGKRCAESLFMDYRRKFWVDTKIIRIFNTYWPNMDKDDGRVVSNFIMQALLNQDITIYGDGTQTRSIQYIDDLVRWMKMMMATYEGVSGPVNIGTEYEMTMIELAETILSLIPQSKSKIVFRELPKDDPKQRRADNKLAKDLLWWQPIVEPTEWLTKTIEYFKEKAKCFYS